MMITLCHRLLRMCGCAASVAQPHMWHRRVDSHHRVLLGLGVMLLISARMPSPLPVVPGGSPLIEGRIIYQRACAMCHDRTGMGRLPLGPRLVDAPWLQSCRPDQVAAIILDGVQGPIPGTHAPYPVMPALKTWLTDQQIADVSTYVLQTWGHRNASVGEGEVTAWRERQPERQVPWSLDDLTLASRSMPRPRQEVRAR